MLGNKLKKSKLQIKDLGNETGPDGSLCIVAMNLPALLRCQYNNWKKSVCLKALLLKCYLYIESVPLNSL